MSDVETTEDTPALPGDSLREGIVDELRRRLGDDVIDTELRPNDDLWVRVATDAWAATGTALREMGFHYFCYLSAIDWLPSPYGRGEDNPDEPQPERTTEIVHGVTGGETRIQMLARVTDLARHVGVTIKADVPDDDPQIASWHAIYAGANWHERETHEMFGIGFVGHPDLRNMYLPGDFEGHPLKKDFPLLSRMVKPWPGIVDVEPMPVVEVDGDAITAASVEGELEPQNPTPDQSDGGVGEAPAEDAAAAVAEQHSVEEAPDHVDPPAGEARTDPGDVYVSRSDETPAGAAAVEAIEDDATSADAGADADVGAADVPPTTDAAATNEAVTIEQADEATADAATEAADADVTETMAAEPDDAPTETRDDGPAADATGEQDES